MEYKYYIQTDKGYALKKPYGIVAVSSVILLAFATLLIWSASETGAAKDYLVAAAFIIIAAVPFIFRRLNSVLIVPSEKAVVVGGGKGKRYLFSEFLDFGVSNQQAKGVLVQRKVSMSFNDGGKNKVILLGIVSSKKAVDRLIEETSSLMS